MLKDKHIVLISTLGCLLYGVLISNNNDKPLEHRSLNEPMVFEYHIEETYNTAYPIQYLSKRDGATLGTIIDLETYLQTNSEDLIYASNRRTLDKQEELQDAVDGVLTAYAEDLEKARIEEERRAAELLKQQEEALRKKEIQEKIANLEDNFYLSEIVTPKGTYTMPYEEQAYLYKICKDLGVDYTIALGVIATESGFDNTVIGYGKYYGYFQMDMVGVELVRERYNTPNLDPRNPYDNILIGVTILSDQVKATGDMYNGLIAYGWGYGNWVRGNYTTTTADNVMTYSEIIAKHILNY